MIVERTIHQPLGTWYNTCTRSYIQRIKIITLNTQRQKLYLVLATNCKTTDYVV
jgi:hypothetical protein